jgi:hypothetical protein
MTYYPDLAPLDYFTPGETFDGRLRAVGWLSPEHDFESGDLPELVIKQLLDLLENGRPLFGTFGFHPCLFCPSWSDRVVEDPRMVPAPPTIFHHKDVKLNLGGRELWLPVGDLMYVAPDLILHYITEHGYRPPDEYLNALSSGPTPGGAAYLAAIAAFSDLVESKRRST